MNTNLIQDEYIAGIQHAFLEFSCPNKSELHLPISCFMQAEELLHVSCLLSCLDIAAAVIRNGSFPSQSSPKSSPESLQFGGQMKTKTITQKLLDLIIVTLLSNMDSCKTFSFIINSASEL